MFVLPVVSVELKRTYVQTELRFIFIDLCLRKRYVHKVIKKMLGETLSMI